MIRPIALAVAAGALVAAFGASAQTFDFRGAQLGMTLDAWRASPPPSQLFHPALPLCTGDPGSGWLLLTAGEQAARVTRCVYGNPPERGRVGQKIGEGEFTGADYWFADGRLYRIELVATSNASLSIEAGLRERFGPPAYTGAGQVRTGAGVTVPARVLTWRSATASITLTDPDLQVDRLSVDYELTAAAEAVRSRIKAADPAGDGM